MKVNSINNYSNQSNYKANPQFQARFSKAALNNLVNPCDAKFMNMHEYTSIYVYVHATSLSISLLMDI